MKTQPSQATQTDNSYKEPVLIVNPHAELSNLINYLENSLLQISDASMTLTHGMNDQIDIMPNTPWLISQVADNAKMVAEQIHTIAIKHNVRHASITNADREA